jgi:two-component sensor histidine kinase
VHVTQGRWKRLSAPLAVPHKSNSAEPEPVVNSMSWSCNMNKPPTAGSPCVNIPIEGLPIAAAALDSNGVLVVANRSFDRLCGRPHSTCSGHRLADFVDGPDRPVVEEALNGLALLEGRAPQRCRIRASRAKRPSFWLAIDITRLEPESMAPYLVCLQAIPRRRRLDIPPMRGLPASGPRSTPAGPASGASSALRDIKPWPPQLVTLSHEFRGPLTAIRGWAEMAAQGALPPEAMSRALTVIGRNAASLSDMIETLFDLSRRAAGSLALKREMLDLNPLAQFVVESTLPAARDRNVLLTVRRTHSTLLVNGDALRLEQVVRNLVLNAIKFTPTGGRVHVHTRCDGLFAELAVTDTGPGIPPDVLPVIFEPFRHEDGSVPPSDRGLGLGLALVRELVRLHDGEVRALSEGTGQGSTFIVRLPVVDAAVAA